MMSEGDTGRENPTKKANLAYDICREKCGSSVVVGLNRRPLPFLPLATEHTRCIGAVCQFGPGPSW